MKRDAVQESLQGIAGHSHLGNKVQSSVVVANFQDISFVVHDDKSLVRSASNLGDEVNTAGEKSLEQARLAYRGVGDVFKKPAVGTFGIALYDQRADPS